MISKARKATDFIESALTLNSDQLVKAARLGAGSQTSGRLSWNLRAGRVASVNFEAQLGTEDGWMQLDFFVLERSTGARRAVTQTISLAATRPHFGGTRWWFVCPVTGERVGRLHLPPGADHFASRQAHRLIYACQTENVYDRAARRARKLMMRLGAEPRDPWIPLKPKGMRWSTYIRYAKQTKDFERVSDGRWFKIVGRL
jgi:hypothetical protein